MVVTPGFRRRALVVALAGIYGVGSQLAHANPTGAQVVNGQAALQTQGSKLTVTNTPGAIINWQSFSIGSGEATYFQQQNAASTVLNRVQAQNPALKSQIDGMLGSNGRVFLINPNGIVFGAGSVIDTQGLVASTLQLNDEDFKSGRLRFSAQAAAGSIKAQGHISSGSGDVYLVAPNVGVDGNAVIRTEGGNIVLAAGEMVEITGRNLNDITFAIQSKDNQVINLGTLSGGAIGVFAGTLNHSGVIRAQTLVNEGGRLILKARGDITLGAGSKTVVDGNTLGGTINILASDGNVAIASGAQISADAGASTDPGQPTRAGAVAVAASSGLVSMERGATVTANGGRGGDVSVNAARIYQDAAIRADGQDSYGGNVRLQADSRLIQTASGDVSARGVVQGGSIKLGVDASVDSSASLFTSATIDASAGTGIGGSVTISGRSLTLAGARVLANGDAGGGSVRVGGGRGGADATVPNAQNVTVAGASSLEASARVNGEGGSVIAWADGSNKFAGVVEARGGAQGGNGGFIEVSGKQETQFGGTANAGAPNGRNGTFLLDPKYILIQAQPVVVGGAVELLDPNPGNNDAFGQNLSVLGNGNIVVFNWQDDLFGSNSGAVYLYDGISGALISNLHGSAANDRVGNSGNVSPVSGTLIIGSPQWNGAAGALTLFNATTGVSGAVSAANSLVGSSAGDQLGSGGLQLLTSSLIAVRSPQWNSAAGAITWTDAGNFATGAVSAANSLVGSHPNDQVGYNYLSSLGGGSFNVYTPTWNSSAGALTWINSAAPPVGFINSGNSLVGTAPGDQLGSASSGLLQLPSGNFLIKSPNFNGGAGAVTWASSTGAVTGTIGAETNANSIFGSAATDGIGGGGIAFLDYNIYYYNYGNFVVLSPNAAGGAGAVSFGTQSAGFGASAPVSSSNSLVGSNAGDHVGSGGITRLPNGNYLIKSPQFNTNTSNDSAGAVTWANGNAAIGGTIAGSASNGNSVYGNAPGDFVGNGGVMTLSNGNFVVVSPDASSVNSPGEAGVGAVSFGTQAGGFTVTPGYGTNVSNSLVGSIAGDHVGSGGVETLNNGNYVVLSPEWNLSSTAALSGAVTWGSATGGVAGQVGSSNSLVGSKANDQIGSDGIVALNSGNYVVVSPHFNTTMGSDAGAVTWANGSQGVIGTIGSETNGNSVFGSPGDLVGSAGVQQLNNGNFLVFSPHFSNPASDAGALTWGSGITGFASSAPVSSINSLVGTHSGDLVGSGPGQLFDFYNYAVVRTPAWNGGLSAVTYLNGNAATTGNLGSNNSLVGTYAGDQLGSGSVQELSSGNYLILSPLYKTSVSASAGAVTWASSAAAIFGSVGSETNGNSIFSNQPGDSIGSSGVTILNNGNFVVLSPNAGNPSLSIANAGAVTFGDQNSGFSNAGIVSSSNSLIGTHAGDHFGSAGLIQLQSSPNILILSPNYDGGAGAITWASGSATTPFSGTVGSATNANSIFGSVPGDSVGSAGIEFLDYYSSYYHYGNFVVLSPDAVSGAGAVTFGTQAAGFVGAGAVSSSNSLVGANPGDHIGSDGIERLYNPVLGSGLSNYLVYSSSYGGGIGAVSWASGSNPVQGVIGSESNGNSIFGNSPGDAIGSTGATVLNNDNFVIVSPNATNPAGSLAAAGAVTFGNQGSGFASPGALSSANSLMGDHANDMVGDMGVQTLGGGVFAVLSSHWNGNMGAISWGSETSGLSGIVGAGNSLTGSTAGTLLTGDRVGSATLQYFGSGYIAKSAQWGAGAGAISYIDTSAPTVGAISAANSLIGSTAGDSIGSLNVVQLGNNKTAVFSPLWDNAGIVDAGAVTWLDSTGSLFGFTGMVSATNSLVGSSANDKVGSGQYSFVAGTSNTYAIRSSGWDNNGATDAGALTWFSTTGVLPTGAVTSANSLVGSNTNDLVGSSPAFYSGVAGGNAYTVVTNQNWNGNRGAVTWMPSASPFTGVISSANSLVGANPNDRVGNGGVRTSSNTSQSFLNGDYIVLSPSFNSSVGAITVGSGTSGISGIVSGANSLVGFGTSYQMINQRTRMLVAAAGADSLGLTNNGQICLYSGGAGCVSGLPLSLPQSFSTNPSGTITITPQQIAAITNSGTDLVLEANSDITLDALSDIVSNNPSGNGGSLTLRAGRSVLLKSDITTDNGNLTIVGNDGNADANFRDPGLAYIMMADGTTIDAGTGLVSIQLENGAGARAGSDAVFNVGLRNIRAGALSVASDFGSINFGSLDGVPTTASPADINIATSLPSILTIGGDVKLVAKNTVRFASARSAPAQLYSTGQINVNALNLEVFGGARIETTTTALPAIDLNSTLCNGITCLRVGDNVITSPNQDLGITALLLSLDPFYRPEHNKKSEGEIEIDAGETCQ